MKLARKKFGEDRNASNESLTGIDAGLYLKEGEIRHVFEDTYQKANVGIPRLDLITLK